VDVVEGASPGRLARALGPLLHAFAVALGALAATLACFLVLPVMQTIGEAPEVDLYVQAVDTAELPPPPPLEDEPEKEEEPEEEPEAPELDESPQPLDLAQLELALGPSVGDGFLSGDFAVKLQAVTASTSQVAELFSIADLDQKPRVVNQPSPVLDAAARKRTPGQVTIVFVVDARGRVETPTVQSSTDPLLEKAALAAVKQWRFEPGKRNGEPVRFRMRVPIAFPAGDSQ
jgi:protein TonB